MRRRLFWIPLAAALVTPAGAGTQTQDLEEILDGLERGIVALERLGRGDVREMLADVADEVRRDLAARRDADAASPPAPPARGDRMRVRTLWESAAPAWRRRVPGEGRDDVLRRLDRLEARLDELHRAVNELRAAGPH